MAINKIYFCVLHLALVILDGSFVLENRLLLIVHLLLGDGVLRKRGLIAAQIDPGFIQQGLVVGQLSFHLGQRSLIGPRIDIQQGIAFVDQLAFAVVDVDDFALHPAGDRDGVDRSDGAEGIDVNADVPLARRRRGHGHGSGSGIGLRAGRPLLRLAQVIKCNRPDYNDNKQGPHPLVTLSRLF